MGYFDKTDLENALSVAVVKGVYDDDHDGEADAAPIAACIDYGSTQCDSFMRRVLASSSTSWAPTSLPIATGVPSEIKFAALDFGIAYTIRRRPDVVRAMGEQPWTVFHEQAVEQMKRYCASMQIVSPTGGVQATVGAKLLNPDSDASGEAVDVPDEPRWSDLGDYI